MVCCGNGGPPYNMEQGKPGCGDLCPPEAKVVSWDGVHFTEAANKFVFDQIVAGALSDPPVALRQACHSRGQ